MNMLTSAASETLTQQGVTTETEALKVGFRGNEYASGSYIGKQEIDGFNRVFYLQSAKNS
jgi:hypothetical protein